MTAARKPLSFDVGSDPALRVPATKLAQGSATAQKRQQVGARVTAATYRQLKARAALQGMTVQILVEQAITEFLANHAE